MTKIYIITEEYGSPWAGHATFVHSKAFTKESEANDYTNGPNEQTLDGVMSVVEVDLTLPEYEDEMNIRAFNNRHL